MERKIISFLQKWQKDIIRKPLILYGPKQVGKSYSALEFGHRNYKNTIYFNTTNNKTIEELFKKEKSTDRLILNLSLLSKETILPEDTLLIFDNVNSIEIVKGLKLFGSERSKYHIIAITSRRENLMEFKGEELQFKGMNEMDFEEFLWAKNEKALAELIKESFTKHKSCPFHKLALELFQEYLMTGGFPEVITANLEGKSEYEIDIIKQKILEVYEKELISCKNLIDIPRGLEVIESLPEQLKKDNKKFQYGVIGTGRRAKEYENTISYLVNNQIVYRSYKVSTVKSPLSSCREKDSFKLYLPDNGILFSMLHITMKQLLSDEKIKEILYENSIAKTLAEAGYALYYYQSEGKAEVNFVIQNRMGKIIPIELITKSDSKAKSLSVFMKKFTVTEAYRVTENNFATKKDVRYIPIYAIFCLNDNRM
ncbi:MAG TPA: ATP-binding protein [Candidatus Faecimonas gallistercoris]|nr:ATP-binding protein [Candidatus Faecimonas gallistercoris]